MKLHKVSRCDARKRFHCGEYDDVKAKDVVLIGIVENVAILTKTVLKHQKFEKRIVFQKNLFWLTEANFDRFIVINSGDNKLLWF